MDASSLPTGTWKSEHDNYLQKLFVKGKYKGGLDPADITRKHIAEHVLPTHFPGRNLDSFITLYKRKCHNWRQNGSVTGVRKNKRSKYD